MNIYKLKSSMFISSPGVSIFKMIRNFWGLLLKNWNVLKIKIKSNNRQIWKSFKKELRNKLLILQWIIKIKKLNNMVKYGLKIWFLISITIKIKTKLFSINRFILKLNSLEWLINKNIKSLRKLIVKIFQKRLTITFNPEVNNNLS